MFYPSLCCNCTTTPVIALSLSNRQGLQYPVRHLLTGATPTSIHQISQTDLTEKIVDLARQVFPQMMRQAGLPLMAVTLALTVCHIDRLIDRINNLGDKNLGAAARETVPTTGPSRTSHQLLAAQFSE